MRDAAQPPIMESLRGELEALAYGVGANRVDECVMSMSLVHAPIINTVLMKCKSQSLMESQFTSTHIPPVHIGERIEAAREAKGIKSQAAAARLLGISPQRYNHYAQGRCPDVALLARMAKLFDTTIDSLMGISAAEIDALERILVRLFELEGIGPDRARIVARIAVSARRIADTEPLAELENRHQIAAQTLWLSEQDRTPDK